MLSVSEDEAAAIRAAYGQRGELSAAVELRRRFPSGEERRAAPDILRPIIRFPGSARRWLRLGAQLADASARVSKRFWLGSCC